MILLFAIDVPLEFLSAAARKPDLNFHAAAGISKSSLMDLQQSTEEIMTVLCRASKPMASKNTHVYVYIYIYIIVCDNKRNSR